MVPLVRRKNIWNEPSLQKKWNPKFKIIEEVTSDVQELKNRHKQPMSEYNT